MDKEILTQLNGGWFTGDSRNSVALRSMQTVCTAVEHALGRFGNGREHVGEVLGGVCPGVVYRVGLRVFIGFRSPLGVGG